MAVYKKEGGFFRSHRQEDGERAEGNRETKGHVDGVAERLLTLTCQGRC